MDTVVNSEGGQLTPDMSVPILQGQGQRVCDLTCVCFLLVFSPADLVSLEALTTIQGPD